MWFVAFLAAVLAVACGRPAAPPPAAGGRTVVVSAAASLSNVLQELASTMERQGGPHAVVNTGASNTLARQIAAGATVDLFISADETQMDAVAQETVPGTRLDLLSNELAIAVPDDRYRPMTSARELEAAAFRRIAIGDPSAVPAGVYAKAYLQAIGVWPAIESRIVPSGSVRLALAAVESGAADAAVVYRTDVPTASHARTALVIPAADGPHIVYPAAVIRSGANQDGARRLLAFLRSAQAAAVFERAGFVALHHDR